MRKKAVSNLTVPLDDRTGRVTDTPGLVGAGVFALLGIWMLVQAMSLGAMAAAFPLAVGAAMIVLSCLQAIRSVRGGGMDGLEAASDDGTGRGLVLAVTMLVWAVVFPHLGMFTTSIIASVILMMTGQFGRLGGMRMFGYLLGILVMVTAFYLLMVRVLNIPMPIGILP
jgi:putative tricarboxylic transport membrane protein